VTILRQKSGAPKRPRGIAGNLHLAQSEIPLSTEGRETRSRNRTSVFNDSDSVFRGQRFVNGWKNSGLPWTYKGDPERMVLPEPRQAALRRSFADEVRFRERYNRPAGYMDPE
jgi:hypothetical protein